MRPWKTLSRLNNLKSNQADLQSQGSMPIQWTRKRSLKMYVYKLSLRSKEARMCNAYPKYRTPNRTSVRDTSVMVRLYILCSKIRKLMLSFLDRQFPWYQSACTHRPTANTASEDSSMTTRRARTVLPERVLVYSSERGYMAYCWIRESNQFWDDITSKYVTHITMGDLTAAWPGHLTVITCT